MSPNPGLFLIKSLKNEKYISKYFYRKCNQKV